VRPTPALLLFALLTACTWGSSTPSTPDPALHPADDTTASGGGHDPRAAPPADVTPERFRVTDPTSLADFLPPTYLGAPAVQQQTLPDGSVHARYEPPGRTIDLDIAPIQDVRTTRAGFELLGQDAEARMDRQHLLGLRFQGNPAQASRTLMVPHQGTLSVVAANTYLVTFQVTPSQSPQEVVELAAGLDVGGLTRLALREHKARQGVEVKGATEASQDPAE